MVREAFVVATCLLDLPQVSPRYTHAARHARSVNLSGTTEGVDWPGGVSPVEAIGSPEGKVFGHIAGRLITLIYALLKKDYETLSDLAPGAKPPEPILYDPEIHKRHRHRQYQALKVSNTPQSIVQSSNK